MSHFKISHALMITGARTWSNEARMRDAFNQIFAQWRNTGVIARPVLISGQCPSGADAMAERLWEKAGFEVQPFPADWSAHGRAAGFVRNQTMVDALVGLQGNGAIATVAAFHGLCSIRNCAKASDHQLQDAGHRLHFSHGTTHARAAAKSAGLSVVDVLPTQL